MAEKVKNFKELWDLVSSFNVSRAPAGLKSEQVLLSNMLRNYPLHKASPPDANFMSKFEKLHVDWWNSHTDERLRLLKDKFTAKSTQPSTVKTANATYTKDFPGSYNRFKECITHVDQFISTLQGPQAKAAKGVKIIFSKKFSAIQDGMDQVAEYQPRTDTIVINPDKVVNSGSVYMSMNYVVLHELGHRYLKLHPQKWNIDEDRWATTPYSKVKGPNQKEEKFAELFAMAKWPTTFSKYLDTLKAFVKQIH